MVARPITAAALAEGVVTELGLKFVHKMHALRIILPDNTLQGSPIYKIEFSFPTNVVGDVTVDITDPYAEATLTNGSTNLTLSIPSDYKAGDYLYAMIFPTDLTGNISYRVFAGDYIS